VKAKSGRSGALCFVEIAHHWTVAGEPWLDEVQTLVFRAGLGAGVSADAPPALPVDGGIDVPLADWLARYCPEERLLFRYSAFMGNGHRIHYDAPYARDVEGYPALVVHGPLLATWLMQAAVDVLGPLVRFSFRAHSPAFCGQDVALVRGNARDDNAPSALNIECRGNDGRLCLSASALARRAK
jgi:3-methylfumaryl-CoA hydratase